MPDVNSMGSEQPAEQPKHRWLAWVGLQAPPPDPDSWVPLATGRVTDPATGASEYASAAVDTLAGAGITAHQRPYVVPDDRTFAPGITLTGDVPVADRVRVAVLVHLRDAERGRAILAAAKLPGGRLVAAVT